MSLFVWSDTHFNHAGILDYCDRKYGSVEEMNAGLEAAWNRAVGPRDDVWFVGDFGFSHGEAEPLEDIFARLHGRKHLVVGNHDEKNPRVLKLPWVAQTPLVTLRENGVRAVACHYPLETWKNAARGYLVLHGHSHGTLKRVIPHRFDVGVESFPSPVALGSLARVAAAQEFAPQDHHGDV